MNPRFEAVKSLEPSKCVTYGVNLKAIGESLHYGFTRQLSPRFRYQIFHNSEHPGEPMKASIAAKPVCVVPPTWRQRLMQDRALYLVEQEFELSYRVDWNLNFSDVGINHRRSRFARIQFAEQSDSWVTNWSYFNETRSGREAEKDAGTLTLPTCSEAQVQNTQPEVLVMNQGKFISQSESDARADELERTCR